jgi:hypothetical protein
MPGTLADLSVATRLALRAARRRFGPGLSPAPDLEQFKRDLQRTLDAAEPGLIGDYAWLDLPSNRPPWVAGGISVSPGESVSYFMAGRLYASKMLDLYINPALQVWCREGETGEVFRGTRASHSFDATGAGPLYFGNYFPSAWRDRNGALATDGSVYDSNTGDSRILIIAWADTAKEGLRGLLASGDHPLLRDELARIEQGDITPPGWHYLWHVGPAEIFRAGHGPESGACVHCRTQEDVGILQRNVDLPLTPDTELSWRWCVTELPSTLREDTLPSHDYLSIAVEFDNGRDITYYWSATLPEGYGYDCPLPNWSGIEYHVVIRSGRQHLGEWLAERRNLHEDYRHYMGEPPARITRVWFIAVSIFQRGRGECDYADISLSGPEGETRLL